MSTTAAGRRRGAVLDDIAVIAMTGVIAGCGLIYEYLLANTAGRMLGAVETVIFAMIGVMIVSMGIGAFLARFVREPFTGFAWLEATIAVMGGASVLLLGAVTAAAILLPQAIAATYGLPPDLVPRGSLVTLLEAAAGVVPYALGALLGVLVGMEIPLLARIRQSFHADALDHNTGTIFGADYVGAGVGAALWVGVMLSMEPVRAAYLTGAVNLVVGIAFLLCYRRLVRRFALVVVLHALAGLGLVAVAQGGTDWARTMEDLLYRDTVVYAANTEHQRVAITRRLVHADAAPVLSLYLNGRLQFDSSDEHIYHAMLTYPALAAAARRERILVIGGGDGLAVRDILRWNPREVVVLDLDSDVVDLFTRPRFVDGAFVNRALLALNGFAFRDNRVGVRLGDAYIGVDSLLRDGRKFDAVMVDLPDPSHPDLARLYSVRFYKKLRLLLAADGAMAIQSTSPYFARKAFLSIGRTVEAAGFRHVDQYGHHVPSLGQWGWTVATRQGRSALDRLRDLDTLPIDDGFTTRDLLLGAFAFPKGYFDGRAEIAPSRLADAAVYRYYREGWEEATGIAAGRADGAP